jgi:hypothetical protein
MMKRVVAHSKKMKIVSLKNLIEGRRKKTAKKVQKQSERMKEQKKNLIERQKKVKHFLEKEEQVAGQKERE